MHITGYFKLIVWIPVARHMPMMVIKRTEITALGWIRLRYGMQWIGGLMWTLCVPMCLHGRAAANIRIHVGGCVVILARGYFLF